MQSAAAKAAEGLLSARFSKKLQMTPCIHAQLDAYCAVCASMQHKGSQSEFRARVPGQNK